MFRIILSNSVKVICLPFTSATMLGDSPPVLTYEVIPEPIKTANPIRNEKAMREYITFTHNDFECFLANLNIPPNLAQLKIIASRN
jgi:hypothetical protein